MREGNVSGVEQLLVELSAVTASVCDAVANNRFAQAAELLTKRGELLEALSSLHAESAVRPGVLPVALRDQGEQMTAALKAKRQMILEKLLEIRKREAAKAYTQ